MGVRRRGLVVRTPPLAGGRRCDEGLRAGGEYHDDSVTSFSALILANARADQGAMGLALEAAELSARKAQTPADEIWAQSFLSLVWSRTGQPDRAAETLARVVPIFAETRFFIAEMYAGVFLGEAYWRAGSRMRTGPSGLWPSGLSRAGCASMPARPTACSVRSPAKPIPNLTAGPAPPWHFEQQSMAVLGEIGAENELGLAQAGYGRLCRDRGDLGHARAYLTDALAVFGRLGTQLEPDRTRRALGELTGSGLSWA